MNRVVVREQRHDDTQRRAFEVVKTIFVSTLQVSGMKSAQPKSGQQGVVIISWKGIEMTVSGL